MYVLAMENLELYETHNVSGDRHWLHMKCLKWMVAHQPKAN